MKMRKITAFYSAEAGVGVAVVFKRIDNCFGIRIDIIINLDEEDNGASGGSLR